VETARTRGRILETAASLLASGGPDSVSIRAVSAAAGIQAPTIYRHFGNKQGLLDAVAQLGLTTHVRTHALASPGPDPVDDLRRGWDAHVAYAVTHPHLYRLTYVESHPGSRHPAAVEAEQMLAGRIQRIAEAGRLRVTEERAVHLVQACGAGTALILLTIPDSHRDHGLSEAVREAVIATVTTEPPDELDGGPEAGAVHLRAMLPQVASLSVAERGLLREWLDRIARDHGV